MLQNSFIFLPRVGATTEQKLWKHGVTVWDDFLQADDLPGIGKTTYQKHVDLIEKAKKNLSVGNRAFFNHKLPSSEHWRLFKEFKDNIGYIDIESTGLDFQRNDITTISIYDGEQAKTLVKGKDLTRENLQQELDRHAVLAGFNSRRFDIPFIKAEFPDIEIDHPHIDLRFALKKIGLTGGLKSIEKQLGIGRDEVDDIDGREAIRLWHRYQQGDEQALDTLVTYNQKDVTNLEPLLNTGYKKLTEEKFTPFLS